MSGIRGEQMEQGAGQTERREVGAVRQANKDTWDKPMESKRAQRCSDPTGRNRAQRWKECSQGVRRDRETGQDQGLSGLPKGIRTPLGLSFY